MCGGLLVAPPPPVMTPSIRIVISHNSVPPIVCLSSIYHNYGETILASLNASACAVLLVSLLTHHQSIYAESEMSMEGWKSISRFCRIWNSFVSLKSSKVLFNLQQNIVTTLKFLILELSVYGNCVFGLKLCINIGFCNYLYWNLISLWQTNVNLLEPPCMASIATHLVQVWCIVLADFRFTQLN